MTSAAEEEHPVPRPDALHRPARLEDAFHRWRERRGRKRGLQTTIVPYAGYGSQTWIRVLCRVVLSPPSSAEPGPSHPWARLGRRADKVRGWRSFFSIPVETTPVTIEAGGVEHVVTPARGGIVDVQLDASLPLGWQEITVRATDAQAVTAPIFVLDPEAGFGIVSDIDDTVMVTALPRPFLAAWNTFVLDEHARTPVAGMAVLYERLTRSTPAPPVIYLSTGAWNVAQTLTRFLGRNLYPSGPLLLTDWGPTHDRWFRSGREHKTTSLEALAEQFPDMKWLLIGDDGQHDEEIYGAFARLHPENVLAIAIRQLSTGEAVLAGGRTRGPGREETPNVPWFYGQNGAALARQLSDAGLLAH